MLDPDAFKHEPGGVFWRFHATERHRQFDVAVPADSDLNPDAIALGHLETALTRIDTLVDLALPAAEAAWQARYNGPLRPRAAWSLIRLFAYPDGRLVLSLNEGDYDTYCLWDVTVVDGGATRVHHRAWGGSAQA